MKVGVLGAKGRMGSTVCAAVEDEPELELVARVDLDEPLEELVEAGAEIAVDFTTPDAVKDNIKFCLDNGIHVVVGTTGFSDADFDEISQWAQASSANAFIAPNFALGAVLMMRFAQQAAPFFSNAEIVERHQERKLDAPSGTAARTARLMNESRNKPWGEVPARAGQEYRGGDESGLRIHSIRVPGSVAHQEVILGSPGETLTIRHDSVDRSSFMPGVILAIKKVGVLDGLVIGLEHLLDL
jgi:4-hydroxy-tetrahydrodipicolinate reductase